jgi:hypothetical protein
MRCVFAMVLMATIGGCTVFTVSEDELKPGTADGITFQTTGRPTYDQVWNAAMKAMSTGMTIVESHKPSGTIKSRVGAAPSGKVVAFYITPTTPTAPTYRIETVSKKPMGLGQPERRNWEPSVVEDFKAVLAKP